MAVRDDRQAAATNGASAATSTAVSPPSPWSSHVTTSAPSEAPSRSAKYSELLRVRRRSKTIDSAMPAMKNGTSGATK